MAITTIEVRVDTELLEEVKPILEAIGITVEESIRIFIEETVRLGQLPFPYTEEDIEEAKRICARTEDAE